MKRVLLFVVVLVLALTACAPKAEQPAGGAAVLKVSDGTVSKEYTVADLQSLAVMKATFKGVTYVGVSLPVLLQDAGIDWADLSAVKAIASDGFSANYDAATFGAADTIVAYATVDGPLAVEDGMFRIVLPNGEGKQNVRMLVEIIAIP